MSKRNILSLLLWVSLIGMACNVSTLLPASKKTGVEGVKVTPASGSGTFVVTVKYYHRLGDPVQAIQCEYGNDGTSFQPSADQGPQEFAFQFYKVDPGTYTVTCTSGVNDVYSADFEVFVPLGEDEPQPEAYTEGGFKKHKPGDFASAGLWMLFDNATSSLAGYAVPRQCLPGVNYTHVGGTSSLVVEPDGTLSGSCGLSYYGGSQTLTGTLTGEWNDESGEISFRLETETVATAVIEQSGTTISGTTTNRTVYEGKGKFTSEFQATGMATWVTDCTTTNPEAAVCMSRETPTVHAEGTVPWQMNFGP